MSADIAHKQHPRRFAALSVAARLKQGWLGFARALGRLNTILLLSLLYFLVLGPVAILHRLFGGDRMRLRKSATAGFIEEDDSDRDALERARRQF